MDRILIIDDDHELCELLNDYLSSEGFEVDMVHTGDQGAEKALSDDFVLVILDVMLPGMNGFDVLRKIREASKVPVIMLTARGDDIDRIVGLEMGADDYLAKPFNPRELVARIRAVHRRLEPVKQQAAPTEKKTTELRVGDVMLSATNRTVKRGGEVVELTSVEFTLLEVLLGRAGEVISRDDLTEEVLGRKLSAYDRSIDVHVSALRKKLGNDIDGERIKTVRGVGYLYSLPEANS
jgi:two-component system response regulator CpxR